MIRWREGTSIFRYMSPDEVREHEVKAGLSQARSGKLLNVHDDMLMWTIEESVRSLVSALSTIAVYSRRL